MMQTDKKNNAPAWGPGQRVKLEFYGEEVIDKQVTASGSSGRVYLPPGWVGHKVKIVRLD